MSINAEIQALKSELSEDISVNKRMIIQQKIHQLQARKQNAR
jgi:hypothetical protein